MRPHRRRRPPDPATDAERQELGRDAWASISHLFMTSAGRFEGIAEALGMGPSDLGALLHLDPEATPSQGELAREWACDASWVTAKVDSLEDLGLVARVPDPTDRRRKTITLTATGARRQTEALDRLYEPPKQIDDLSLTDLRALKRIFAKLDIPDLRENGHLGGRPAMKGPPRRAAGTVARAANAAKAHESRTRSRALD